MLKRKKFYALAIFLAGIWLTLSSFLHPFYVSITSITYNPKNKTLEVASRLFHDDLEVELNKNRKDKIDILRGTKDARTDSAIAQYFKNHLKVQINKKSAPLHYIGYEIDKDVAWCYFEISTKQVPQQIQLYCDLLYPSFRTQSNIFHTQVLNHKQSAKLDHPKSTATLHY